MTGTRSGPHLASTASRGRWVRAARMLALAMLAAFPGFARIIALVAMLSAAALAGAWWMAERIARDELTAHRNALLEQP